MPTACTWTDSPDRPRAGQSSSTCVAPCILRPPSIGTPVLVHRPGPRPISLMFEDPSGTEGTGIATEWVTR